MLPRVAACRRVPGPAVSVPLQRGGRAPREGGGAAEGCSGQCEAGGQVCHDGHYGDDNDDYYDDDGQVHAQGARGDGDEV